MARLKRLYGELHLKVNETKSAVASAFGRKFLGYSLWAAPKREVKRRVSTQARETFKARVRQLTKRSAGRSMEQVIEKLRRYVLGWKAYYQLAQTPNVFRELDEWMRHRLRALQLKQWRHGRTIYRELLARGASNKLAAQIAKNGRRWWHNSALGLNKILTVAYFDQLGMPKLSS